MNVSFYLLHADDMQFSAIDLGDDRLRGGPVQFYTRHISYVPDLESTGITVTAASTSSGRPRAPLPESRCSLPRPAPYGRHARRDHRHNSKGTDDRLGHSSTRAAMIYQHATRDRDKAIAHALGTLADKARNGS